MKRYDFTVVGTAAAVSVLKVRNMPEQGKSTPVFGDGFLSYSNGGMGLNICAGLAKLGASLYPVLTYADERQGEFLHDFIARYHMPADGIQDPPKGAGGTTIIIQDGKKNHMTMVTNYENRMPESEYYGRQRMEPHFFADSKMVVLTAPMAMNTQTIVESIEKSGVPLAFSMRKDPWALPHEILWRILCQASILFANEGETAYLVEEFGLADICDLFSAGKMRHIVQTLGADGSNVYSKGPEEIRRIHAAAVPCETEEIETVGAGDGYVSGFLYGYIHGRSIADCAMLGSTFSSFVLEKEGSITNLPTQEQLLARYAANQNRECE